MFSDVFHLSQARKIWFLISFFIFEEFFVLLEAFENPQKDYPHIPVHAVNYVHPFFLSPKNQTWKKFPKTKRKHTEAVS
jgi:hypothetical protein